MSVEITHDNDELIIYLKNQSPIELTDFATSMLALSQEYQSKNPKDHHLYIKEVKTGSICAVLVAGAFGALPFVAHANDLIDFGKHMITLLRYLKGERQEPPPMTQQTLANVSKFVEPIAKDNGSILQLEVKGDNNKIVINSLDANAIQNRIVREQERLKEPLQGNYNNVVLYWKQTRQDTKNGYKGVIESLSDKEVKVRFADSTIQSQMVQEHPYKHAYVVDVNVQTVKGQPALYTITEFYESIELGD